MSANEMTEAESSYFLVVGPSGSGISTALDIFSDYGFMTVGDIQAERFIPVFHTLTQAHHRVVFSLTLSPNDQHQMASTLASLQSLKQQTSGLKVLYLDAPDQVLVQRYMNSGKEHLFADEGLHEGVLVEKGLYAALKPAQDFSIDTSTTSPQELRLKIAKVLGVKEISQEFTVNVVSFGFKYGMPMDAELVFDMRFIKNPFYEDSLREQTGLDQPVKDYIFNLPHTAGFFKQWSELVATMLPHYQTEGKSRLTIAVGCTGGKHRSVCMSEALTDSLKKAFPKYNVTIRHRESFRWSAKTAGCKS